MNINKNINFIEQKIDENIKNGIFYFKIKSFYSKKNKNIIINYFKNYGYFIFKKNFHYIICWDFSNKNIPIEYKIMNKLSNNKAYQAYTKTCFYNDINIIGYNRIKYEYLNLLNKKIDN